MLTRKDYEMLARLIKDDLIGTGDVYLCELWGPHTFLENLSSRLSVDNPNFDKTRFFKACGYEE
jgi:hypothetical protein